MIHENPKQSLILLTTFFFISIGLLSGCKSPTPTHISAKETQNLIDFEVLMLIIDVREEAEFRGPEGYIPNSRNYPWNSGELNKRFRELPPQAPIITVSRTGRRSRVAMEFLQQCGFRKVLSLAGGLKAWDGDIDIWSDPNATTDTIDPNEVSIDT